MSGFAIFIFKLSKAHARYLLEIRFEYIVFAFKNDSFDPVLSIKILKSFVHLSNHLRKMHLTSLTQSKRKSCDGYK